MDGGWASWSSPLWDDICRVNVCCWAVGILCTKKMAWTSRLLKSMYSPARIRVCRCTGTEGTKRGWAPNVGLPGEDSWIGGPWPEASECLFSNSLIETVAKVKFQKWGLWVVNERSGVFFGGKVTWDWVAGSWAVIDGGVLGCLLLTGGVSLLIGRRRMWKLHYCSSC